MSEFAPLLAVVAVTAAAIIGWLVGRRAARTHASEVSTYRNLIEHMPDALVLADQSGRIVALDRAAETLLGWTRSNAVGRTVHDMVPDWPREPDFAGSPAVRDSRAQHRNGTWFDAELAVASIRRDEGWLVAGILRDLSRRKQAQAQLRLLRKMEAVASVTGGLAHDFNNLLTVILNILHVVNEKLPADSKLHGPVALGTKSARQGADLVRRLRVVAGRQAMHATTVDLNAAIGVWRESIDAALGAGVALETALEPGLWQIQVDADQMEVALVNLCLNAREAMAGTDRGAEPVRIEAANVSLGADDPDRQVDMAPGDYVRLTVIDRGEGMTSEVAERAFDPFYTTKGFGTGSGLGLSMVYGFVKQSGGQVAIDSTPGRGTTVRLYFPRSRAAEVPAAAAAPLADAPPTTTGPKTVLIVEDQSEIREVATAMIEGFGYKVLTADSGAAALRILDGPSTIDLLFTDIIMPGGVDGIELAAAARAKRPGIKVLYTSGDAEAARLESAGALRDAAWLAKPYLRQNLADAVRNGLG
ncbi:MAG: PAS domain S-box protein [Alphaproteobacteria bacterium]|nr:PAS domain S-box protein [Alphaproteobacteria bacterium]